MGEGEGTPGGEEALVRSGGVGGRERLKALVLDGLSSSHSRRAYGKALDDFLNWLGGATFTKAALQEYRSHLESLSLSPSTINLRLAALRKLALEASDNGLLDAELAAGIARVKGVKRHGIRLGNWATAEEAARLLTAPDARTLKGTRGRAILAVLVGCALRRSELIALDIEDLQERDGRAVFADIVGKGGRVRTVPVPDWVERTLREWLAAAGIREGKIFRAMSRWGSTTRERLSAAAVLALVAAYAEEAGMRLSPHDLRRTCPRLCRQSGGALEQIQFLLGHASVQTTERYLGGKQELAIAVNDHLGIGGGVC